MDAYNNSTQFYTTSTSVTTIDAPTLAFVLFLTIIFAVFIIATMWQIFKKAGKPGWASLVPVYNTVILLEIVGKPLWWIFLMFIPFVNFVIAIIIYLDLAKAFGKGTDFGLLLIFLPIIALPMLAFSKDTHYVGPVASPSV